MKDYRQLIKELPSKTVVMAFGRFNPPTIGHELLVKAVKKLAQQKNADHVIYASRSQDAKKNPLSVDKKVKYLNLMFRNTHFAAANEHVRTFIEAAKELNKKYKNIIMVAGSDRVPEFKRLLTTYNGKEFNYDTIEVISAGERDPDADDATGMSASKMRAIAVKGNYIEFKKGLPSTVRDIDGRRLMNDIREGMGLEPIKEQIILVKNDLREKYFRGEIFNEGDIVESNGEKYTIIKRGSNHLLLKENSGALVSKWIQDVQPTEEKDMNESLTDKTLKPNDKLKVARIIATMLGVENAETTSNPENLINNALRKVRTKALNPEALHILDKMLNLATEQGIDYDSSLKPSKLKEGVTQTNGTDKISVTTDSPVVDKNSNYNIAKDILRFNDFKKLKKVQEQHKGGESQADHNKDNESDIDADFDSHKADKKEVGHTLVSAGGQDNLRRRKVKYHLGEQQIDTGMEVAQKIMKKGMTTYGKEGGHELTAQHIATNPEHSGKQKKLAQSFISKMHGSVAEQVDLSEAAPFKTKEDAVKYAKEKVKTHRDKLDGIEIHAHSGGFDVNHTSNSSGRNSLQKIGAKHVGTIYKEEVQLGEATVKTQKYSWGTMKTVHHGADFSIPLHPEHHQAIAKLKDEQEHKFKTEDGKHWTARRKGDEVHFQGANNGGSTKVKHTDLKEETIEEKKVPEPTGKLKDACWKGYTAVGMKTKNGKKVPNCVPVSEASAVDVSKVNHAGDEPHDEEWEETGICPVCSDKECECQTDSQPLSTPSEKPFDPFFKEEEEDGEVPELSDDEIEKMADGLTDDDYLDLYDEDEVGIIDDETGEELPKDEEEEKKLDEAALMEVLSRMERIKAKARIRRTASKRERATKIALKRYSDTKTVNKRARRLAIKLMKQRLVRGRDPSKLSVGEKERIERMIEKRKAIIGRVAMRLVSRVRKVEKARLSHSKYTKGSPNVAF